MTTSEQIEFNPLDPAFRVDPYPMYKRLLEEAPVYRTSFGLTVFSRYEDCREIFKDHKRFSGDPRKSPMFMAGIEQSREAAGLEAEEYQPSFLSMDSPDHTRLRRLVNLAFKPRAVEALRPRVEQFVDEMLDRVAEKGQMDIVADLAYPLPVAVICEMLGIPREDHEAFNGWSAELARSLDPEITVGPEALKRRAQAAGESMEYFRELIERRRSQPRDDILSALIAAEEEGDKMSEGELISTCSLILVAGHETTVILIANAVLQLLRHPDQLAKFVASPDLAQGVVEESLRFDPPVQFDRRFPLADTQVGGYPVWPAPLSCCC